MLACLPYTDANSLTAESYQHMRKLLCLDKRRLLYARDAAKGYAFLEALTCCVKAPLTQQAVVPVVRWPVYEI